MFLLTEHWSVYWMKNNENTLGVIIFINSENHWLKGWYSSYK